MCDIAFRTWNPYLRRVGTYHPEKYAYRYLKLVHFWVMVLRPFTLFITWIARLAAVPFGVELNRTEAAVTEEEIISIVDEAHEQGVIQENEAEMIQNIISFNETEAHDIMTHRTNVVAFDQEVLLKNMIDTMLEEGNSRYPVYEENIDNIRGIVHYKDALKFMTQNPWAKFKPLKELPGIIREASLIPETRSIGDLFHTMQAKKIHMAVVVDEYGQTAGIVTMEDILEEIVGDILDEYDEDEVTIRTQKDHSLIIDGLAYLEDVEEELDIDFGDVEFETLNGYLTSFLGHVPSKKDVDVVIKANGYMFTILSIGNKTISKVRAEKLAEEKNPADKNNS
ncbi:MAG: hemolysin family protein [Blautia massiliensis (ex Durand et al. 2017)]|uniref:hemolysin family protein n=1 Tax=Blautia massiliensis (ex Durand et al. 2017) TaxID=1737424 RepID=UPI003995DA8D